MLISEKEIIEKINKLKSIRDNFMNLHQNFIDVGQTQRNYTDISKAYDMYILNINRMIDFYRKNLCEVRGE